MEERPFHAEFVGEAAPCRQGGALHHVDKGVFTEHPGIQLPQVTRLQAKTRLQTGVLLMENDDPSVV